MAFLTTLGLVTGGLGAINNFISGGKMAREAERGLQRFQHQELTNLAEPLKPSLEVEQQALAQVDKMMATVSDVAAGQDAASAMATLGLMQEKASQQEAQIFGSMLEKEFQADVMGVQDEQQQRAIIETRKMEELQSLKTQAQAGREMQASAISDVGQTLVSAGLSQEMADAEAGKTDPTLTRIARAAARRGATGAEIREAFKTGGFIDVNKLNTGEENKSKFATFFRSLFG